MWQVLAWKLATGAARYLLPAAGPPRPDPPLPLTGKVPARSPPPRPLVPATGPTGWAGHPDPGTPTPRGEGEGSGPEPRTTGGGGRRGGRERLRPLPARRRGRRGAEGAAGGGAVSQSSPSPSPRPVTRAPLPRRDPSQVAGAAAGLPRPSGPGAAGSGSGPPAERTGRDRGMEGPGGRGRRAGASCHRGPCPSRPSPPKAGGSPVAEEARLPCSGWKGPVAERRPPLGP